MNWHRSYWVHLFEVCQRVNVNLKLSNSANEYSFEVENHDDGTVILPFAKPFSVYFKDYLVRQIESEFVKLEYQGLIVRENKGQVDE